MFTLSQLAQITSLTQRTLRSYLAAGILQGTKENGRWLFSEEQAEQLLRHSTAAPAISAKRQGIVFDFLGGMSCTDHSICVLLDRVCPQKEAKAHADFFCQAVSGLQNIRFSYTYGKGTAHFILSGEADELIPLLSAYHARSESPGSSLSGGVVMSKVSCPMTEIRCQGMTVSSVPPKGQNQ